MKKISILALHNTIATSVIGPMDVFVQTGLLWNYINNLEPEPLFEVEIVSMDGLPVRCLNNVLLQPHGSINDVSDADLILISCVIDIEKTLKYNSEIIAWLQHKYEMGASIASVCTGAFLLAETGLLDGKTATTHWGFVDEFKQRYPNIILKPDRLITDEGDLYCSGAMHSGIDLAMYLVEKQYGHEVAVQCSKSLLHDMGRESQAPYTVFQFQKKHRDGKIKTAQQWIEDNYADEINIDKIAKIHNMSRRSFERRFKKATGDTPLVYLHRTKVEAAKRFLESEKWTFDEISFRLNYENSCFFRKVFKKHTGLLPSEYQQKFKKT